MNRDGTPTNLVPGAPPGNSNRLDHGAYAEQLPRDLEPRAREIAEALMTAPHVDPLDRIGVDEIGALVAQLERIDAALVDGRVEGRQGQARPPDRTRGRLSGRLQTWLKQFGLTHASRAEWARQLAEGESLAQSIRRRREAINGEPS